MLEKIIKAFGMSVDTGKNARESLRVAQIKIYDPEKDQVRITATDGHILLSLIVDWSAVRIYAKDAHYQDLPEKATEGYLNVLPKNQVINKKPFYYEGEPKDYPKWESAVPYTFNCPEILPQFTNDTDVRACKIFELVENLKMHYYLPDLWNGSVGTTLKILNKSNHFVHGFMLVMPVRPFERVNTNSPINFEMNSTDDMPQMWKKEFN